MQHVCVGVPDAKNLVAQPNTVDRLHKHAEGVGGGVTGERGVVPSLLLKLLGPTWGVLSTELAF